MSTQPIHSTVVPTKDLGGPRLQFLASPEMLGTEQQGVLRGTLLPGGFVPIHSHGDVESFLVLEGTMSLYQDDGVTSGWTDVTVGDLAIIQSSVKHAWRNSGDAPAVVLIVTTGRLYGFLDAVTAPCRPDDPPAPPSPEWLARFHSLAAEYGYWHGSPEENASIGIHLG